MGVMTKEFDCFGHDREWVRDELPMAEGFAFMAWQAESQPWVKLDRVSPGYIAQESAKGS